MDQNGVIFLILIPQKIKPTPTVVFFFFRWLFTQISYTDLFNILNIKFYFDGVNAVLCFALLTIS